MIRLADAPQPRIERRLAAPGRRHIQPPHRLDLWGGRSLPGMCERVSTTDSERKRRIWDRPHKSHWPVAYINSWACRATSFRLPGIKSQADAEAEIWEGSSHMITATQARSDIRGLSAWKALRRKPYEPRI